MWALNVVFVRRSLASCFRLRIWNDGVSKHFEKPKKSKERYASCMHLFRQTAQELGPVGKLGGRGRHFAQLCQKCCCAQVVRFLRMNRCDGVVRFKWWADVGGFKKPKLGCTCLE